MRNYHSNNGVYRRNNFGKRQSFGQRNTNRKFKSEYISVDKLVAKAVDSEDIHMFVDDYQYSQFNITKTLKRNAYNKGYSKPTQIQFKAIPEILAGKDILGVAGTGSGKTAAFLIPMIDKITKNRHEKCLIVIPTRELAMQIQDEFKDLSKDSGLRSALLIGGNSIRTDFNVLRRNPEFLICTPGRLKDLTQREAIDLSKITNVILDEVDRMLDMGFINDIRFIIDKLDKNRQSLFFSATLDKKAEEVANTLLMNPVKIEINVQEPGKNVDQDVVKLEIGQNKFDVLLGLLKGKEFHKVLIFTSTKRSADKLSDQLYDQHINIESLHGGKRQNQRTRIINNFKQDRVNVLVATDVASRGLDIDDITHVINYDMPNSYQDYIHRIGRTGRTGKKGFALTFI